MHQMLMRKKTKDMKSKMMLKGKDKKLHNSIKVSNMVNALKGRDSLNKLNEEEYNKLMKEMSFNSEFELRLDTEYDPKNQTRFILSYYSANGRRFDFFTCILVLYDCLLVPFANSFGIDVFGEKFIQINKIIEIVISIVYFFDLLLGFRRAYLCKKTGDHVTDPKKIACRYMQFYFWIDMLSCIPYNSLSENVYLRFLRLLKILRISRFKKLIQYLGLSTAVISKVRILNIFIYLLMIVHWICCIFYAMILRHYREQIDIIYREDAPEDSYKLDEHGNRIPLFNFSYWMPQV